MRAWLHALFSVVSGGLTSLISNMAGMFSYCFSIARESVLKKLDAVPQSGLLPTLQAVFIFLFCLKYVFVSFFTQCMLNAAYHNVKARVGVDEN